ncbi:MAG: replication-associated recombination protein A [Clostridia bacterium]
MDFFTNNLNKNAPLSQRMRANSLKDFLGQKHIIHEGSLLKRAISADRLGSCIFYGPPGTGKTTLANIVAETTNAEYRHLNAVSSGVSEAKEIIIEAKKNLALFSKKTYMILDECHRWSKTQSDCVLSAIENGEIIFIGTTTENPYSSMTKAILSRCRVFEFHPLSISEIKEGLIKAIADSDHGLGNYNLIVDPEAIDHITRFSYGDMRVALDSLELAVITTKVDSNGVIKISLNIAEEIMQKRAVSLTEQDYYDLLSAFCKSVRGGDPDAALFYSLKLTQSGIDPMIIARRLVVHSAEDVGLADPYALTISLSALNATEKIGLPECLLPLNEAIIYVTLCPKSNSVYMAIEKAKKALEDSTNFSIPKHIINRELKRNNEIEYKYPHDFGGWVNQQYLPDELKSSRFYYPSQNGQEKCIIISKLKNIFKGESNE